MAKVTLIVYTSWLNVVGVRSLSSYLKSKGHNARIIFMLAPVNKYHDIFSDMLYGEVIDACRDSDLLGISITSNFHVEAIRATNILKKLTN